MNLHAHVVLELGQALEVVAGYAGSDLGKEAVREQGLLVEAHPVGAHLHRDWIGPATTERGQELALVVIDRCLDGLHLRWSHAAPAPESCARNQSDH